MALYIRYHSDTPMLDFPAAIAKASREHRERAGLQRAFVHYRATEILTDDMASELAREAVAAEALARLRADRDYMLMVAVAVVASLIAIGAAAVWVWS